MASLQCLENALICQICGKEIEVINNDITFSIDLHNQSHKKLSDINDETNCKSKKKGKVKSVATSNTSPGHMCPICNSNVDIFNNDIGLSLQLHLENHKDQEFKNNSNTKQIIETKESAVLDQMFDTFSSELKHHRDFITDHEKDGAYCKVCKLKIEAFIYISNHLKTKLHEDNILSMLKQILPSTLQDIMEFVSFFASNLWCNLCNSKMNLCSKNCHETIVNIMAHNNCDIHIKNNSKSQLMDKNDKAHSTLMNLAKLDPLIYINKSVIDYKKLFHFKCRLCDKKIWYDKNETVLLSNFTTHLNSVIHKKRYKAYSVIKEFESAHVALNDHKFIPTDNGVFCSLCNILVEENSEQLFSHVTINSCHKKMYNLSDSTYEFTKPSTSATNIHFKLSDLSSNYLNSNGNNPDKNCLTTLSELSSDSITPFGELLNSAAVQLNEFESVKNMKTHSLSSELESMLNSIPKELGSSFLIDDTLGKIICKICNCTIPPSTSNIQAHGISHQIGKVDNVSNSLIEKTPQHILGHLQNEKYDKSKMDSLIEQQLQQKGTCKDVYSLPQNSSVTNDLHEILNNLSTEYDTSCVVIDHQGKAMCSICNCIIPTSYHNIQSHIVGMKHKCNVEELSITMLFKKIPKSMEANKSYITIVTDKNKNDFIYCNTCNVKIPVHYKNLREHLMGAAHKNSCTIPYHNLSQPVIDDKIEQNKQFDQISHCSEINYDREAKHNVASVFGDVLLDKIVENNINIKSYLKYLRVEGDNYMCRVCNATIVRNNDEAIFNTNLIDHFYGDQHKTNLCKLVDDILLKTTDTVIILNKHFIRRKDNLILCTLCNCHMSPSADEQMLINLLSSHFLGNQHKGNSESKVKVKRT